MQEEIKIVFHKPNNDPQTITVRSLDPINVLVSNDSLYSSKHLFLLNNLKVLSPALSFKFFKIKNGDEINLIIKDKEPQHKPIENSKSHHTNSYFPSLFQLHEHSHQLFQLYGQKPDHETMQQAVEELADPETAVESAKLRDQHYNKIEGSASSHRRLMKRYLNLTNAYGEISNDNNYNGIQKVSPNEPSTSALPCMWKRGRQKRSDSSYL